MIYLTSDIHGKKDDLMKLLGHVGFFDNSDNFLYILGDVIDRNNLGGVDILKWLIFQPNVQLLLGNHELMLLQNRWLFDEISEESIDQMSDEHIKSLGMWSMNGGDCTMNALSKESVLTRKMILNYLDDCPLIEEVIVNDKSYILVHGGLGNFDRCKDLNDYTPAELLWSRPNLDTTYAPDRFTVIVGHTPTGSYSYEFKNRMIRTDSWWNIDTGAARIDGHPMLLCLDTGREYYIEENNSVIEI